MTNATNTLRLIDEFLMQGGYSPNIDAETLEREASLVSAAPDMLAALESAQAWIARAGYTDRDKWQSVQEQARAAIAKAKGK